ncbi:endonuclease MutS2 [Enterococcus raffinosus]|uniref:Endonuclease MutS2 n=1 Tax=Enterococcus raffinosus TaxID=71452 RepID=A0AAW8T561_9ENTE|nr:endonuclease MutS2 [Enterococcus raffinosus]MDT2522892.1 endonuclease MutS2 [Enterococcus raffinosus]MDT2530778.1 endonuclease MutS2 [Enterococcus raffinosus]MDT2532421.1 endonuclease MutS2 [Enterococcus raffinosus]MDT2544381.1 endonuclease MutS2 [Enterococcus raffinosus]MDT2554378.1 endonuclease MutS2 [Enterococcus raffinosus]
MNNETFEKTQFNEIKAQLSSYAISSFGKKRIENTQPHSKLSVVEKRLTETTEAKKLLDSSLHVPFMGLQSIEHITNQLEKGFVLTPQELLEYADFLRSLRLIRQFFEKNQTVAPLLNRYGQGLNDFNEIEEEIYQVIRNGRIIDDASRELRRARRDIAETQDKIQELLKKFIRQNKEKLQEAIITKRNDVFTVPIKSAYKKQVKGTIIELSSKGTTAYIEPSNVSRWNEQLVYHKMIEEAEVYQILATLTGLLAEALPLIQQNIEIIAEFEHIFARGKFSRELKGITPEINSDGYIHLVSATHPLINNAVPLDLTIGEDYRGLTITGPNAGGKTVVLKTVALMSLMTMIGLQIPAKEVTEIAIFDQIFVDIGDAQSIENALSTFSGHMQNISEILRKTHKNSLILLDELGSGTEPNEGAALAIAIMEEFYQKGSILITTTHYGEIKRFAEQHPDFITAAMDFDAEHLTPKYRLLIGQTGESNALWIAKKMAISEQIITKAQNYFNDRSYDLEKKSFKTKTKKQPTAADEMSYYKGDKVFLLEQQKAALVYQEIPFTENVKVFLDNTFIEVPKRRMKLEFRASELYPADYELENLFEDFHTRKERRDIDRGSKKAQRKLRKEALQRRQD